MSDMTVFVINGDKKAILNSLRKVFNVEHLNLEDPQPQDNIKNYFLTPTQSKAAQSFLKTKKSFAFYDFAKCFNKRPSNLNLINYLTDQGYTKRKKIVENKLKYYWTKI